MASTWSPIAAFQAFGVVAPAASPTAKPAPAAPSQASNQVAAEGRIVTYPGAEIVVGTDLAGTIVLLEVQEKEKVRRGNDGKSWRGKVEEIPDSVVGRRLKPQDPGKPGDTRVLLVKIALLEPTPLKLGQRVEIRID